MASVSLFKHRLGRIKCQSILRHFANTGFADNEEEGVTRASVIEALRDIVISRDAGPGTSEFDKAMEEAVFGGSSIGIVGRAETCLNFFE